ncbi:hypothetical protein D9M68_976520 [compost metagenome]
MAGQKLKQYGAHALRSRRRRIEFAEPAAQVGLEHAPHAFVDREKWTQGVHGGEGDTWALPVLHGCAEEVLVTPGVGAGREVQKRHPKRLDGLAGRESGQS